MKPLLKQGLRDAQILATVKGEVIDAKGTFKL
jgi:hypothetical protein